MKTKDEIIEVLNKYKKVLYETNQNLTFNAIVWGIGPDDFESIASELDDSEPKQVRTAEEIRSLVTEIYCSNQDDYFFSNVDEAFHKGIEIGVKQFSQFQQPMDYLNKCIEKATPNLSKIKDVDKELAEIRGKQLVPIKDIKTEVIKFMGSWTVRFTIGNQSFYLYRFQNKKSAEWTEKMLQKAFDSLIKEQPEINLRDELIKFISNLLDNKIIKGDCDLIGAEVDKYLSQYRPSLKAQQPSDEEIEKYVVSKYPVIEFQDKEDFKMDVNSYFRECLIRELKAMREGLIPVSGKANK